MKTEHEKHVEQLPIAVYWWNFRQKTLDYKRTYSGLMKEKEIEVKKLPRNLYRFAMNIGCGKIKFTTSGDYLDAIETALKLFYAYLGDKTLISGRREYRINW